MELKAIIIEDEIDSQISLSNMIKQYCQTIKLEGTTDQVSTAVPMINEIKPDLIFLDIELPGDQGFVLFNYFPKPDFKVIFTTAYNQYALKAFKLSAVDYLLKPIDIDELIKAVQAVQELKSLENSQLKLEALQVNLNGHEKKLVLPTQNGLTYVKLKDILYCEAKGNYTMFFLKDTEKILVSKTLKKYTETLEAFNFFRISRSFLINLNHVKKYGRHKNPTVTMCDNHTIALSVNQRDFFLDRMNKLI